jgi:hypothetical protein
LLIVEPRRESYEPREIVERETDCLRAACRLFDDLVRLLQVEGGGRLLSIELRGRFPETEVVIGFVRRDGSLDETGLRVWGAADEPFLEDVGGFGFAIWAHVMEHRDTGCNPPETTREDRG